MLVVMSDCIAMSSKWWGRSKLTSEHRPFPKIAPQWQSSEKRPRPRLCPAEDDVRTSGEGGGDDVSGCNDNDGKTTIKRVYRYEMLVVMMVITVGPERLHRYD